MFKKKLKLILPIKLKNCLIEFKNNFFNGYSIKSYSQEGEDMILRRIFEEQKTGFYIDIGAHHPFRFSNTCFFYRQGWSGINIDAMPNSMKLFRKYRKRDINLEIAISDKKENLTYYIFNEPALNGFSKKISKQRNDVGEYKIIATKDIKTFTLEEILNNKLSINQEIDFISIDVEGLDSQVLISNNWNKYRPKFVLIEILNSSLSDLSLSEEYKFLSSVDYEIFAKTMNTIFFKRCDI